VLYHPNPYSTGLTWAAMFFNVVIWFSIFYYLEQIMPSEFGVQKHWLFCLRKEKRSDRNVSANDLEANKDTLHRNDPI
jgi:hypothetical protein